MAHYPFVYSIANRYTSSREETEEIINDVFLKIFFKIHQFDENYSLTAWIKKITINQCIDRYRSTVKNLKVVPLDYNAENSNVSDEILLDDPLDDLKEVLDEIPEKYRLIFNLYVFEEYTHKEIAEKLNIAIGTSKSAVSRSKTIIKNVYLIKRESHECRKKTV